MRKQIGLIFKTAGFLLIILLAGLYAILFTPLFSDLRRTIVANYLSHLGGDSVTINGSVDLDLGVTTRLVVNQLDIVNPDDKSEIRQQIELFSMSFRLWPALFGKFDVNSLTLQGARVVFFIDDKQDTTVNSDNAEDLARFVSLFLNKSISQNLSLSDVTIDFKSPGNGWDETLEIEKFALLVNDDETSVSANGVGKLNDIPINLDGNIGSRKFAIRRPVNLTTSFSGTSVKIGGTIDTSKDIALLDIKLNSQTTSLGDLLVALRLKRVLDGKGEFSSRFHGPMNAPSLSDIRVSATGQKGMKIEMSGSIENIFEGKGVGVRFNGILPERTGGSQANTGILDIDFKGFSGNLSGNFSELELDNLVLQTNVASAELKDIGPISVGRITKDTEGRLGIRNIRVLNGPPENRTLDLKGDINDALQLKGLSLKGALNIATADLFEAASRANADELGRLKGEIQISDLDESIGIDRLEASVVESKLISLNVVNSIVDLKDIKDITLDVDLSIPSFKAFAEALGESSNYKERFDYKGQFALVNQYPKMEGKLTVGKTKVLGKLRGELKDKMPHLFGNVESKLLYLEDLSGLFDILGLKQNKSNAEIRTEVVKDSPQISLELGLKVDEIAGKNRNVGNINGKLSYRNKILSLDPLSVSYLGGTIKAQAKIDSTSKVKKFASKGDIRKLPIGRLLSQLKAPQLISGSLTTEFNVRGTGDDALSWVKSLSGNVNSSISGGTLGTNLIDLSGLNLLTWLTTSSTNRSVRLVCAVVPLSFRNGRGSTQRLVLETQNVQVVGRGFVDIRNDSVNLNFQPIPKRQQLVNVVSPFQVTGRLSRPSIALKQGAAGRVAAEVVTLPLNVLGLLGVGVQGNSNKLKPCVVPTRNTGSTGSKNKKSGNITQGWKPQIFFQ